MFCPQCGHENEDENRFCVECGRRLKDEPAPERRAETEGEGEASEQTGGLRGLAGRLIGSSRRERLITIGIVVALAVAVAATLALSNEEEEPSEPVDTRHPYIQEADRVCLQAKQELEVAHQHAADVKQVGLNSLETYMREAVPITARMRAGLAALDPPPEYAANAAKLEAAVRQIQVAVRQTARFSQQQDERALGAFTRVQTIGGKIESRVEDLGLIGCETIQVVPS